MTCQSQPAYVSLEECTLSEIFRGMPPRKAICEGEMHRSLPLKVALAGSDEWPSESLAAAGVYKVADGDGSTDAGSLPGSSSDLDFSSAASFDHNAGAGRTDRWWQEGPNFEIWQPSATWYQDGQNESAAQEPAAAPETLSRSVKGQSAQCRWHASAGTVGTISADGHVFTKNKSSQKVVLNGQGMPMELSTICMVFDSTLRQRGKHVYNYQILSGELGAADGAGFVFDSKVRRNNIQQMRTVFLNKRGVICIRNRADVHKLKAKLPPLEAGMCLTLDVDLDKHHLTFAVSNAKGESAVAEVALEGLFDISKVSFQSGFFCAVVTKEISVSLW